MNTQDIAVQLPQSEVAALVEPYQGTIQRCLRHGWDMWERLRDLAPDLFKPLKKRTRASFVHDHVCDQVRQSFNGVDGVVVSEKRGVLLLTIAERVDIRFKKLDKKGRARNIITKQQANLAAQMRMPGFTEAMKLTAGYQLNELQTEMTNYLITYQRGRNLIWAFPLLGTEVEVIPLFPQDERATRRRVSPKRTKGTGNSSD